LPDRYASKVLSLKHLWRIGMETLGPMLTALGMKLIAVEDEVALERYRPRYVKRNASQVRSADRPPSRAPRKPKRRANER
jgi:hypothetical protein